MRKKEVAMIPTVLLFNVDADKGRKIKALCLSLKLRARSVPVEDLGQRVGARLGRGPPGGGRPPQRVEKVFSPRCAYF